MGVDSFSFLASVTASTKRPDYATGTMVAHLASVAVWPLAPVDARVRELLDLPSAAFGELWQTFTTETDITEGDALTVGGVDYPVRAVGDWPWRPTGGKRLVLVVEEPKT